MAKIMLFLNRKIQGQFIKPDYLVMKFILIEKHFKLGKQFILQKHIDVVLNRVCCFKLGSIHLNKDFLDDMV